MSMLLAAGTKRKDVDWRTIASKMGVPVPGGATDATPLACGWFTHGHVIWCIVCANRFDVLVRPTAGRCGVEETKRI